MYSFYQKLFIFSIVTISFNAFANSTEMEQLLTSIKTSGCKFERNGGWYKAESAEAHLRMKLEKAGSKVKTPEEFIQHLASESSFTGKPYYIKCGDEKPVQSKEWLGEKLKVMRSLSETK